jgi:hypothetical protein
MKTTFLSTLAIMIAVGASAPAFAASADNAVTDPVKIFGANDLDKRRKPRVPGGSGCDDPWDIIEHPECRG